MAVFLYLRGREITDDLVELMIRAVKCIGTRAESNVEKAYIKEVKKVRHKNVLLYKMASAAWDQNERIQRTVYELCVFKALREKLRCKEIWVVGADRFRNPDEDLPSDFGFSVLTEQFLALSDFLWPGPSYLGQKATT